MHGEMSSPQHEVSVKAKAQKSMARNDMQMFHVTMKETGTKLRRDQRFH